jgi:phosphatidylserine/phosphatidylglycerophosphate/cardiolipin synthase-like enzyme
MSLGLAQLDARITFSPHNTSNSVLKGIADDIRTASSSIFYSLAFLSITPGVIRDALAAQTGRDELFVSGISDMRAGVEVSASSSNRPPTYVAALDKDAPPPFRNEPTGLPDSGLGTRMHHKFVVVDFDRPSARVYLGSYNMSKAADGSNGENLLLIRDRRVATSYMIEAVRIIDHYQFRAAQKDAKQRRASLTLRRPPKAAADKAWWEEDYSEPGKIKDRELFA